MRLQRATLADVWAHTLAKKWPPSEHEYRLLVQETLSGRVWAGIEDKAGGLPVAIGGVIVPTDGLPGTCWLSVTVEARQRIAALALMMRRVIAADRPDAGVVCAVDADNTAGRRLAHALGFRVERRRVAGMVEWGEDERHRRHDHRQSGAPTGIAR